MKEVVIEKQVGRITLSKNNLLIEDTINMIEIEYWEERLEKTLKQPFAITFRKNDKGKFVYSIYTNLRGKTSVFK